MPAVQRGEVGLGSGPARSVGLPLDGVVQVAVFGGDLAARGAAEAIAGPDLP